MGLHCCMNRWLFLWIFLFGLVWNRFSDLNFFFDISYGHFFRWLLKLRKLLFMKTLNLLTCFKVFMSHNFLSFAPLKMILIARRIDLTLFFFFLLLIPLNLWKILELQVSSAFYVALFISKGFFDYVLYDCLQLLDVKIHKDRHSTLRWYYLHLNGNFSRISDL